MEIAVNHVLSVTNNITNKTQADDILNRVEAQVNLYDPKGQKVLYFQTCCILIHLFYLRSSKSNSRVISVTNIITNEVQRMTSEILRKLISMTQKVKMLIPSNLLYLNLFSYLLK